MKRGERWLNVLYQQTQIPKWDRRRLRGESVLQSCRLRR
jgi:hypothetical protein